MASIDLSRMTTNSGMGRTEASSSLDHYSQSLCTLLADASVTELCVQSSGEVFLERPSGWSRVEAAWATTSWARRFARLVATSTEQRVDPDAPLLSATLPGGERIQVVLPPATAAGCVAIAIRRPSSDIWSLGELAQRGLFEACCAADPKHHARNRWLTDSFTSGDWESFLRHAVQARLNIVVAGATASGKTTLTKALICEISCQERLISIEDAAELDFRQHPNSVRLFYSKDDQGRAHITPKQLLEASLRLRPDRILLAELRGEEAYYFLRNVSSGHPGSITSIHAGSVALAFEQLGLLVKESLAGREMALRDIHRFLRSVVDVVVYCARGSGDRRVTEVWWRDAPGAGGAAGGRHSQASVPTRGFGAAEA